MDRGEGKTRRAGMKMVRGEKVLGEKGGQEGQGQKGIMEGVT